MENSESKHYRIVGLPGDCIGPEVYASARRVLQVLAGKYEFSYELDEQLIGGAAVDATATSASGTSVYVMRAMDRATEFDSLRTDPTFQALRRQLA